MVCLVLSFHIRFDLSMFRFYPFLLFLHFLLLSFLLSRPLMPTEYMLLRYSCYTLHQFRDDAGPSTSYQWWSVPAFFCNCGSETRVSTWRFGFILSPFVLASLVAFWDTLCCGPLLGLVLFIAGCQENCVIHQSNHHLWSQVSEEETCEALWVHRQWLGWFEDDAKSASGYCFSLGPGIFSWNSKKQDIVARSTTEAEFVAAAAAVNQALWLKKILIDLHMKPTGSIEVLVDNEATIAISHNELSTSKSSFSSWEKCKKIRDIILLYCKTEEQLADTLTKHLPVSKFELLRQIWSLQFPKQGGVLGIFFWTADNLCLLLYII